MTKAQERAIERIKQLVNRDWPAEKGYEVKEFTISENEYFVSVVIETGLKDDEGTYAAVFARDRAQLFVGKKGGVTYPVSKKLKNGKYKHYEKRFEGYSILQAVVDQF